MKKSIIITIVSVLFLMYSNKTNAQIYSNSNTLGSTGSAIGYNNTSNAAYTLASGIGNSVTANYSMSTGYYSQAFGQYSVSMGVYTYANGYVSFAFGNRAKSLGYEAYSFGSYAQATGTHSYSFGRQSIVSGTDAYAFGYYSGGTGNSAFSIGNFSTANSNNSFSIGEYVSTSSAYAMTIGRGINTSVKLNNNQSNSLMVGFNSNLATLFVGSSAGAGTFGKVGIATSSPIRTFDVNGMSHFSDTMSIGTTKTNGSMLAVAGKISAEEVEISMTSTWPDFVFNTSYELNTLAQVEEYINKHSHLPNVPSAKEVAEKGINIAEMDAILLQKIEELTLYAIAQQKQLDKQEKALTQQQKIADEQNKLIEYQTQLLNELLKEKK